MGRHDRDDGDRRHGNSRHSEERYSLQELKERARREVHPSRRGDDHHHRSRNDRDDRRRRSRSRSGSPRRHHKMPERRPSNSRSPSRRDRDGQNNRDRREPNERRDFRPPERQFDRNGGGGGGGDFNRRRDNNNYGDRPPNTGGNSGAGTGDGKEEPEGPPPEIKPNFELTGALAKDTNTFNGVVVKYHEPAEAKKPKKHWRFYPFKGDTALDYISLHRQSAFLFGRDRRVADVPVDHPSISKQHAVLQFRSIELERDDGTKSRVTRPYIIDLESGNGTFVNNKQIEARRYVELMEQDIVKFGFSTREYVLLHDKSQGAEAAESDTEA